MIDGIYYFCYAIYTAANGYNLVSFSKIALLFTIKKQVFVEFIKIHFADFIKVDFSSFVYYHQ